MQVTNLSDQITHAVIGGEAAIAVTTEDSAEFYHMLSSTLYRDQILAVVREVICNAWDAHIEYGCEHLPIIVKIEDGYFIVRDYGSGIPRKDIGERYGKYGGSTKRAKKKVTGGFGLGCKAPWAYVDHFEVTSWADGEMTVYSMSKSNAEVNGKPNILPMFSVPTEDHGLQVKIKIKKSDTHRFTNLVHRIAANGEMNALFDGKQIPTIPFNKMESNFLITTATINDSTDDKILARYGHVIYPIEDDESYATEYRKIKEIIRENSLDKYRSEYKIVFQIEPGSITITPSRESLSMQEHTIKEIGKVLKNFLKGYQDRIDHNTLELISKNKQIIGNQVSFPTALTVLGMLYYEQAEVKEYQLISSYKQLAESICRYRYPQGKNYNKLDMNLRLKLLANSGFGNRAVIKSYLKASKNNPDGNQWFTRNIVWPIVKNIDPESAIRADKLYLFDKSTGGYDSNLSEFFIPANKLKGHCIDFNGAMPLLQNYIVLTYNRRDVQENLSNMSEFKHWFRDPGLCLTYITPRSPQKVAEAKAFFQKLGYYVVDMTTYHDAYLAPIHEPIKKAKLHGIPSIKSIFVDGKINATLLNGAERIKDPKFVIKLATKYDDSRFVDWGEHPAVSRTIAEFWGDQGAIVTNVNQEAKYVNNGAMSAVPFVEEKLVDYLNNNPQIKKYFECKVDRIKFQSAYYDRYSTVQALVKSIQHFPDLADYLGIRYTLSDQDRKYIKIMEYIVDSIYKFRPELSKFRKAYDLIQLSPSIQEIYNNLSKHQGIKMFNESILDYHMDPKKFTKRQKERLQDFLLELIEG